MLKIKYARGCLNISIKNGKLIIIINEDNDTYLLMITVKTHIKIAINAGIVDKAKNTPQVVATPFPPLNFRKIVHIWPKITKAAIYALNIGRPICNWLLKNIAGKTITQNAPLAMSIKRTAAPISFPRTLNVFVAPTLPLPYFLISIPLVSRPVM